MAIQRRKQDLEEQLEKINNNLKLFSKEVVYVGI